MISPFSKIKVIIITILTTFLVILFSTIYAFAASKITIKSEVGYEFFAPNTIVNGKTFKGYIPSGCTSITFDYYTTDKYPTEDYLKDFEASDTTNKYHREIALTEVSGTYKGLLDETNTGDTGVTIYYNVLNTTDSSKNRKFATGGTEMYVLSKGTIMANPDCAYMFNQGVSSGSLKSITFNNIDTSNVTSMKSMFEYQELLRSININKELTNFNTSNVTDMSAMFFRCSVLKELDLTDFNTSKVEDMSSMFGYCQNLTELDLSSFNTSKVEDMSALFSSCFQLKSISLSSDWKTSNVTKMNQMFSGCRSLTSLPPVSSWDINKVTTLLMMFSGCSGLTGIISLPFDNSKSPTTLTNLQGLFQNCNQIEEINISGLSTPAVTNMSYMFYKCTSLKKIKVGSGWSTNSLDEYYRNEVFTNCNNLVGGSETAYIEKKVTDASYAVIDQGPTSSSPGYLTESGQYLVANLNEKIKQNCSSPTSIAFLKMTSTMPTGIDVGTYGNGTYIMTISGTDVRIQSLETIYANPFSGSMFNNFTSLTQITFNNFDTSKVVTMANMFDNCYVLKKISAKTAFDTSKVENMSEMFYGCHKLETIGLGFDSWDTSNVKDMSGMFAWCESLTGLDVSAFDTSKVENMARMFNHCEMLDYITFGTEKFKTDNVTSMSSMFDACKKLQGLNYAHNSLLPEQVGLDWEIKYWNVEKVKNMAYMFRDCDRLQQLDLSSWEVPALSSTYEMFDDCDELLSVACPQKWDDLLGICALTSTRSMFANCSKLRGVSLKNFPLHNIKDMSFMFYACTSLVNVNITTTKTIPMGSSIDFGYMFSACSSLTSIDMSWVSFAYAGSKVLSTNYMFSGCSNLQTIYASCDWNTNIADDSFIGMFNSCINLKSNYGCAYNVLLDQRDYCKVDTNVWNHRGYFTAKS